MGLEGNEKRELLRRVLLFCGKLLGVVADDVVDEPAPALAFASGQFSQEDHYVRVKHHSRRSLLGFRHEIIVSYLRPCCQVVSGMPATSSGGAPRMSKVSDYDILGFSTVTETEERIERR